jgi:hypothetical protein
MQMMIQKKYLLVAIASVAALGTCISPTLSLVSATQNPLQIKKYLQILQVPYCK